jgi:hypothetical protein
MSPNGRVPSSSKGKTRTPSRPRPQSRKMASTMPSKKPPPSSNPPPAGRMTRPLPFQALRPAQLRTLTRPSFQALNTSQTTSPHAPMSALFRTPESPSRLTRTALAGAAELSRKMEHAMTVHAQNSQKHRILSNFTKKSEGPRRGWFLRVA